jgi:hypothetical protein
MLPDDFSPYKGKIGCLVNFFSGLIPLKSANFGQKKGVA